MRAENLISIFLTLDDISEVNQYDFYMEQFSVTPKYIKIPNNKDEHKGILVLETLNIYIY